MNTVSGAMAMRLRPYRRSAEATRLSTTPEMCWTSRRVAWKALFAVSVESSSTIPRIPRSSTASWLSTTMAQAPIPISVPWRRRSNGSAASSTLSSVATAPVARKPEPIHSIRLSLEGLSPPDHDDAPAAAGADPVLGEGHALGRRRTGGVDMGVRAAGPDELRELAVAHGEDAEEEATVEDVGIGGDLLVQLADPPLDLAERLGIPGDLAQILQGLPLGDTALVGVVPAGLVREAVEAGKALAKMTPVSSRSGSGRSHRSGRYLPVVVLR